MGRADRARRKGPELAQRRERGRPPDEQDVTAGRQTRCQPVDGCEHVGTSTRITIIERWPFCRANWGNSTPSGKTSGPGQLRSDHPAASPRRRRAARSVRGSQSISPPSASSGPSSTAASARAGWPAPPARASSRRSGGRRTRRPATPPARCPPAPRRASGRAPASGRGPGACRGGSTTRPRRARPAGSVDPVPASTPTPSLLARRVRDATNASAPGATSRSTRAVVRRSASMTRWL